MLETTRKRPRLPRTAKGLIGRINGKTALRTAAVWLLQGGAALALTGSRLLGDLSPFSAACCAAGLACGWSPLPMALGCAMFGLLNGWDARAVSALVGVALIGAFEWTARRLLKEKLSALRDGVACLEAFAGVLLPGIFMAGGIPYNDITAFLSATVAALLAPSLIGALSLRPGRRRLLPDERLSCALFCEMLLIGMGSLPYAGGEIAEGAAVFLTLILASRGPAMGAMGGIACGAALALGSGVAPAGSALGLCGLMAGCVRLLPRPAAAVAFALGNALALTNGIGFTLGGVGLWPLLAGALLYCLMPEKQLRRAARLMEDAKPRCDPERLALRLRRDAGERLARLGAAFSLMARGCSDEEAPPDEAAMLERMRAALCADCADYARCWQGDHPEAGRLMCRLLSEAACRGEAPPVSERPVELVRHCRRSAQMDRRLQPLLNELAGECRLRRARNDLKGVMAKQLSGAADALNDLSTCLEAPPEMDEDVARVAAAALDRIGLRACQVTACREGGLTIAAALKDRAWDGETASRAAAALEAELGVRFRCEARPDRAGYELAFRQIPSFAARASAASLPAKKGEPCGDSAYAGLLPDGRLLAVLSDGMGSGAGAAGESERAVQYVRAFFEAGLPGVGALEAVNALLQARGPGELFATLDVCVVDLLRGEAELIKLGACPSLRLTGGRVELMPGGHLPIGILETITPGRQIVPVSPGDTIILYSDGVADELREGQTDWLVETARGMESLEPGKIAKGLLRAAAAKHGRRDDMSVIAIRIEKEK